jgi:hypothetical protein
VVQKELLEDTTSMLKAADEVVICHICTSILMAIKTTYSTTPINIQVRCSVEFYDAFTLRWTNYTPQCTLLRQQHHLCTPMLTCSSQTTRLGAHQIDLTHN